MSLLCNLMKSPSLVMVKLSWLQRIWWAWMIGVPCLTMPGWMTLWRWNHFPVFWTGMKSYFNPADGSIRGIDYTFVEPDAQALAPAEPAANPKPAAKQGGLRQRSLAAYLTQS
uniref:Transmembrane protein n=1 Tax=Eutreptiella gymnastica TaxID=73025 RepID=A0A7S1NRA6_9EUGL